jgi:predicted anti-sigma-YlaC factor YlaD
MIPSVPSSECLRARESISAQLDLELSEFDSARLATHLRECPDCSAHARRLASIAAELRAAPPELPELEIWLPQRRLSVAMRAAPLRVAAVAAALVVGAGLSFVVGHNAASGGRHATAPAGPPQTGPAAGDLMENQVLAILRHARLRDSRPAGRLIFV